MLRRILHKRAVALAGRGRRKLDKATRAGGAWLFARGHARAYDAVVRTCRPLWGKLLRIEVASVCQLKCPACSTASGANKVGPVGWGRLSFDDFVSLLARFPDATHVELSNWGEIFLNQDLARMIAHAAARGVVLRASNGVNLNTVRDDVIEAMVEHRFERLTVSIDGASDATYRIYRKGGDFDAVIANVRRINEAKARHGSRFPKLTWQFVVFGHNEHELPAARALAEELGMEFKPKLNHTATYSPIHDAAFVERETGLRAADRRTFRQRAKRTYSRACMQLWESPQINWDGKLLGCCVNKYGDFGNVLDDGVEATLGGERYAYAKRMVFGLAPPRDDVPCTHCPVYRKNVGREDLETHEWVQLRRKHARDERETARAQAKEAKRAEHERKARAKEEKRQRDQERRERKEAKRRRKAAHEADLG